MAKGWFRRKKGKLVYYYYNANGDERSKVVGLDTMTDEEGWLKVGELGLDKRVAKSDPVFITFGELAEKYLANYPFNKKSTKETSRASREEPAHPRMGGHGSDQY